MVLEGVLPTAPAVNVGVVVAATAFVWVASGWLESSAERLAEYYRLPDVIQGSVVVAIGSSFPELASVLVTALAGVFDMGVGAIVGSAIFNVLVIPALSGILSEGSVDSSRTLVYKEAQFYMLAVSVLVVTFALAVIYYPVGEPGSLRGLVTRPLAVIPLLLYALYVFIQWQDVADFQAETDGEAVSDVAPAREWAWLAASLAVILLAVELLVSAVEHLNATFGIPEFVAGVTIIAAATSLPDALVSVRSARADKGVTSLGNVLGSNTFDLLVAIPLGVLLVGQAEIDFAVAIPMFAVLTFATILLFTVLRTDLAVHDGEAYLLLGTYVLFVAWIVAETVGATGLVEGV
jgi:cation:H+ antiporter